LRVYPVPVAIADGWARVTERAIELQWTAPARTSSGTPLEAIAGYQIYRSQSGEEGSFQLVGTSPTARYEDTQFSLGQRYVYRLRTLAQFGVETVESESSRPVEVEARDIFPPPAPGELVAIGSPGRIDLTWDASAASDLAGYFVYRRLESGQDYARLVGEPLRVQSFADTQVDPEKRYAYVVTAVDQTGNESLFSAEVVAEALAHNTAPAP
jgi:fibronectin type 3 domain-containing protein